MKKYFKVLIMFLAVAVVAVAFTACKGEGKVLDSSVAGKVYEYDHVETDSEYIKEYLEEALKDSNIEFKSDGKIKMDGEESGYYKQVGDTIYCGETADGCNKEWATVDGIYLTISDVVDGEELRIVFKRKGSTTNTPNGGWGNIIASSGVAGNTYKCESVSVTGVTDETKAYIEEMYKEIRFTFKTNNEVEVNGTSSGYYIQTGNTVYVGDTKDSCTEVFCTVQGNRILIDQSEDGITLKATYVKV